MTLDRLLENARIVDGTGAPWFRGAVGIEDGHIAAVYRTRRPDTAAEDRRDVDDRVVAPGFVDTHSHSDLEVFADPLLEPKLRQGITTEVLGQDGFSMAPIPPDRAAEWQASIRGLDGELDESREWDWETMDEYLDALESASPAIDLGTHVGHGAVRFSVLGMKDRDPDGDELEAMRSLVAESLDAGALGFSTGLIYTPCSYASTDEVRTLASALEPYGRPFVAHVRSEGRWIWDALDEFLDVGADANVPVHLSHFKMAGTKQHGRADRAIALLDAARDRGIDVTVEQYPYDAGSTKLSAVLPPWVHARDAEEILALLQDEDARERMREDVEEWRIDGWENTAGLCGWDGVSVTSVPGSDRDVEGRSVAAIAADRDAREIDVVCDLLVESDLAASMRSQLMIEDDVRTILAHDRVNVCTDGLFGGKPHPRVYGAYPRVLGHYSRDENLLSLEEAVRKMTSLPARAMGLQRKGVLRPGMDADLVVFDPDTVASPATYDDPRRHPQGIDDVLVDGRYVLDDGEPTGERPGTVLRA